jgi:GWxTD domain-containing protein
MRTISILSLVMLSLALATPVDSTQPGSDPTQEEALKELVFSHPDSAILYAKLALLKFASGTPRARALATGYMQHAVSLEPQNTGYRLMLAEMYINRRFLANGVSELEQILEIDPLHDLAHSRLGRVYMAHGLEAWDSDWLLRATAELTKVRRDCPAFCDARRNLALCYLDLGLPDSSIAVLRRLPRDSLDVDALLVLGMSLCETGEMVQSYVAFTEALDGMDPPGRASYTSIQSVASSGELAMLAASGPQDRASVVQAMWKQRDPNPATFVNERLVEHMARVGFADLHFSVPELGRKGSQTARGEVYIRYGKPLGWVYNPLGWGILSDEQMRRLRGGSDLTARPQSDDGSSIIDIGWYHRDRPLPFSKRHWRWDYQGFAIDFEDRFHNGDFTFPYEGPLIEQTYEYIRSQVPEIYQMQIRKHMMVVLDAVNLIGTDGRPYLRIEYACDTRGLVYVPEFEWPRGRFEVEISVLDTAYNNLNSELLLVELEADSSALHQTPYPLIGTWTTTAPPGKALAAVSVKSTATDAVGFAQREIKVRSVSDSLQLSDIELRFAPDGPPNPSHTYLKRGKVYLTFSVHNASTDEKGLSDLEVAYRLARREEAPKIFEQFLDIFAGEPEPVIAGELTSLWSQYRMRGIGTSVPQTVGIDLSPLSGGNYAVIAVVRDRLTGRTASSQTWLRIESDIEAEP